MAETVAKPTLSKRGGERRKMCWRSEMLINPSRLWAEPRALRMQSGKATAADSAARLTYALEEVVVLIERCVSNVSLCVFLCFPRLPARLRRFGVPRRPLDSSDEPHQLHETCPASNATQVSGDGAHELWSCERFLFNSILNS